MAAKKIDELLPRYYDGLTDEHEEAILQRFFSSGGVPESMTDDKEFFNALHNGDRQADVPEGLERRIEERINSWSKNETKTMHCHKHRPAAKPTLLIRLRRACGMAASVAAVALLGAYLHGRGTANATDRAKLAQARTALVEFSTTLNNGLDKMEEAREKTKEINKSIDKCLRLINTDKR